MTSVGKGRVHVADIRLFRDTRKESKHDRVLRCVRENPYLGPVDIARVADCSVSYAGEVMREYGIKETPEKRTRRMVTDDMTARIMDLHREGHNARFIAEVMQVDVQTIYRRVRLARKASGNG